MKFIRVLGPVVILIFIVGLTSTNASVVNLASQGVGLLGALFALLFGIYAARRMLYNIRSNEQTGNRISKLLAISMLVMVVGFGLSSVVGGSLFGNGLLGLGTPVRGLLGLIGPIVFIVSLHRTDVDPRGGPRHYKTISKVCLVLLGFLGGILPALILAATGYFILWSRWCQLTNSKCL